MKIDVLYNSNQIFKKIREVIGEPDSGGRRVVLVAYLGGDAETYLSHPDGLEIICNPQPGATNPEVIRKLRKRGAEIRFSDDLHMKVYWSETKGCIITSANASANALGKGDLKEAGIYLPPGQVDIDRLINYADPKDITNKKMEILDRETKLLNAKLPKIFPPYSEGKDKDKDFLSWYNDPHREVWKLGWWEDSAEAAKSVKEECKKGYGSEPKDWNNFPKGVIKPGEWILNFKLNINGKKIREEEWMVADMVLPVEPDDKEAFEEDYPYQAAQAKPSRSYPKPPFKIDQDFRKAFREAIMHYGIEKITKITTFKPPKKLLRKIAENMESKR
jgi:hypothetical protein